MSSQMGTGHSTPVAWCTPTVSPTSISWVTSPMGYRYVTTATIQAASTQSIYSSGPRRKTWLTLRRKAVVLDAQSHPPEPAPRDTPTRNSTRTPTLVGTDSVALAAVQGPSLGITQAEILQALGFNPRDPKAVALALVAERYQLDILLRHCFLIQGQVYVSHSGLLHLAHQSGQLDGIQVEVEERQDRWVATASIYRKDMRVPFTYTDECLKNETKIADKRKRAITRAERNALRRAFDVAVDVYEEDRPEPPITLSDSRPEIPRRAAGGGALPGEGGSGPGLEPHRVRPSPDPPSPGLSLEPWKSVVIRCREMNLSDDDRHDLAHYVTEGRSSSMKDITPAEASKAHLLLRDLQTMGEKRWLTSETTKSTSSSQPSDDSPASTSTSPTEPPSGDAA